MADNRFRIAVCASITAHLALFAPVFAVHASLMTAHPQKDVVVYYLPEDPVTAKAEEPARIRETPKVEIARPIEATPPKKEAAAPRTDDAAKKAARVAEARKQAKIRSTRDYINYYQLIREKIRDRLKSHYHRYIAEGEVELVFILHADGRLESARVDPALSSPDATLQDIALRSVRDASPFPAFPKALSLPRMTFNLQVSFQRE